MSIKQQLGIEIAKLVQNNQVLGLGTGSTAEEAIRAIGERVKREGSMVYGVPTSNRCEELAMSVGIKMVKLGEKEIDWGFDGADEIERETLNILKGGWGCMTREKLVAKRCVRWIVVANEAKIVNKLGEKFPIPVEVQEDQMGRLIENLYEKYQPVDITVRQKKEENSHAELVSASSQEIPKPASTRGEQVRADNNFLTDFGNPVIDVKVLPGSIKPEWEIEWEMMPGVVGTGLFLGGYADELWIGKPESVEKTKGKGVR